MPRVIDLSTLSPAQGFVVQGDAAYDHAGWSVSAAGDVDGDGFDDLIVGAPDGDDGGSDAGEAYVVFGGAGGLGQAVGGRQVVDLTTLTAAQGVVIRGDAAYDYAGWSVSAAGDVDSDGFADVIVGAPGGGDAGEAYVVFGGAGGFGTTIGGRQVLDLTTLSAAQGFVIQGHTAGDFAAGSVSAAGDVNDDGFADVIVGVQGIVDAGFSSGEVCVLFGGAGGFGQAVGGRQVVDLTTLTASQGFIIESGEERDGVGSSFSPAGDVNGDGFADVIVGAPGDGDGGWGAGAAYVVFGGVGGFGTPTGGRQVVDLATLTARQGFVIQGDAPYDYAGSSVSATGDVDGDGCADLIVGAPFGDDGGRSAGEAYVVFGGTDGFGTPIDGRQVVDLTTLSMVQGFVIRGDAAYDEAGLSVSTAGDVDGDGFADLIVGSLGGDDGGSDAGAAYVVFGGADGFGTTVGGRQVVDLTTLTPAEGFVIRGDAARDYAGRSVSAAGDVDGDGFDDLIVGADCNDDGGDNAGEAYVIFGGNFTGAVDRIGGAGDDLIRTRVPAGRIVFGAQGDDTLLGNRGTDSLNGGSGDDSLVGGADDDTVAGGSGDDRAVGGRGDDRAQGGDGNDGLAGWAGNDSLFGEANADTLAGNAGNDRLDGGQGGDVLRGGAGADALVGGGRGDVLFSGAGTDMLTGGTGGDRFNYGDVSHSAFGAGDTITDFRSGFDHIVLNGIAPGGTFIGGAAFTGGGAIEARFVAAAGQLQVDVNNDGVFGSGDLEVNGLTALAGDDLLFV